MSHQATKQSHHCSTPNMACATAQCKEQASPPSHTNRLSHERMSRQCLRVALHSWVSRGGCISARSCCASSRQDHTVSVGEDLRGTPLRMLASALRGARSSGCRSVAAFCVFCAASESPAESVARPSPYIVILAGNATDHHTCARSAACAVRWCTCLIREGCVLHVLKPRPSRHAAAIPTTIYSVAACTVATALNYWTCARLGMHHRTGS